MKLAEGKLTTEYIHVSLEQRTLKPLVEIHDCEAGDSLYIRPQDLDKLIAILQEARRKLPDDLS